MTLPTSLSPMVSFLEAFLVTTVLVSTNGDLVVDSETTAVFSTIRLTWLCHAPWLSCLAVTATILPFLAEASDVSLADDTDDLVNLDSVDVSTFSVDSSPPFITYSVTSVVYSPPSDLVAFVEPMLGTGGIIFLPLTAFVFDTMNALESVCVM